MRFGPPSADTILRVFRNVNADKIEKVFIKWAHGIHIVSAWADELSLILGQVKTDEKSNEITAIPELLELIDIRGMIIIIDAIP